MLPREDGVCKRIGSWPAYILKNSVLNGQTWRGLEEHDIVAAGAVGIMVDNSRFVWAQAKGCGRDEFIYTLAKYIEVGNHMEVSVISY